MADREPGQPADEVDVTLARALKIWWSFAWRGMVLMLAIVIPLEFVAFFALFPSMKLPRPGEPADHEALRHFATVFPILWLAIVSAMVFAQALGMRWMLRRARWSDFRLVVRSRPPS